MRRVSPSVVAREQLHQLLAGGVDHQTNIVSAVVEAVTRQVVQELLEGEQQDFLGGRGRYDRRGEDQPGSRNGYERGRLRTAEGFIDVAVQQVRGTVEPFRSSLMGFLDGNSEVLESLVNEMYARGLSTRDVEDAFRDATGELLITKSAVSDITDRLWEDYQAFISRDLSEVEIEYLFVDAVFESLRRHGAKEALLVGWAIAADGGKHLLHLAVGNKESEACWTEFFRGLLGRGLRMPTTHHLRRRPGPGEGNRRVFPGVDQDPLLVSPTREHPGQAARRGGGGGDGARLRRPRRPHPGRGPRSGGPADRRLQPDVPGGRGLLRRRPRRLAGDPPGAGPAPHPGPDDEPGRTVLRRGTPPHQGDRPVPGREGGDEPGVRHHDPRRRPLVPSLHHRPGTPPAETAARQTRTRPATSRHRQPEDRPTQTSSRVINRPPHLQDAQDLT